MIKSKPVNKTFIPALPLVSLRPGQWHVTLAEKAEQVTRRCHLRRRCTLHVAVKPSCQRGKFSVFGLFGLQGRNSRKHYRHPLDLLLCDQTALLHRSYVTSKLRKTNCK
ncbi:hypothetical protein PAXRUDRAFT_244488 [Paxillus rubicundulus Ve08.2h10]|uniref:Uncharacterized protein n=1 Tax=Paxillus rubicundulus Ve08.2h10 TaxID=930991 RepID=A0A0D0E0W3_9AGAM|nr:hypothetical protein PAXRUDRAFT_244488 [Paxillus rubicundulus Ve08.2h10]